MKALEACRLWHEQTENPEVEREYTKFNQPDTEMLEALMEVYWFGELHDMLVNTLEMDMYDVTMRQINDERGGMSDLDKWRLTAEYCEEDGIPFGHIMIALDMYLDGMFDDEGMDSIGRMEDYETC